MELNVCVPFVFQLITLLLKLEIHWVYTQWISSCIATAREQIPGSIDNYVTGVSERRQQRGSLKDEVYRNTLFHSQ
ncbi:hypothetical protein SAMN05421784_10158 [Xenorhabdus koppenhoeferi]|uniref:Uncharacterized protein n=1 Tax=Xenorhabdus koppenhoeferi TaxID=351659 RepID=A0A1I7ESM7_9GAMM|nr:hypothetical protein SAMN05421784_10158 [Xenorhabdus koppenhoeferi]